MSESRTIASRYVTALFALAVEQKQQDAVHKDLQALKSVLASSPSLKKQLASPIVDRNALGKVMAAVLEKIGACALSRKFFQLLAANQRMAVVDDIITLFGLKLAESRGEVVAEVVSAYALSSKEQDGVIASLKKATGKAVNVEYTVDPDILGGLILKVGGRMMDDSVQGKIEKLRSAMKRAV